MYDKTRVFDLNEINDLYTETVIKEVYIALDERGYNPINQIVGFLVSGDPGYICNHNDARRKMLSLNRSKVIELLLKTYLRDDL